MKIQSNYFCISLKKLIPFSFLFFLLFINCNKKETKATRSLPKVAIDSTVYENEPDADYSSEDEIKERKKYIAFLKDFLSKKENEQSIDTLNTRVEAAMEVYANGYIYKDEDFTSANDDLTRYVESKNDLKIAESFYTSGLLESYGYFSIADGHPINEFKKGAKLGSVNCIKYLAIIYFERILHKHNAAGLCDPVCMSHRGRNYIEETSLANLTKAELLSLTSGTDNFFLKSINDHVKIKMSDEQMLSYVLHLRTHYNPLFNLNTSKIAASVNSARTSLDSETAITFVKVFTKLIESNPGIKISDMAELHTFNYPAYEDDDQFLFWVKIDLNEKGIETFNQLVENYDLNKMYGIIDFGSPKIYTGLLKYFIEKGDQNSENLLKEYAKG